MMYIIFIVTMTGFFINPAIRGAISQEVSPREQGAAQFERRITSAGTVVWLKARCRSRMLARFRRRAAGRDRVRQLDGVGGRPADRGGSVLRLARHLHLRRLPLLVRACARLPHALSVLSRRWLTY